MKKKFLYSLISILFIALIILLTSTVNKENTVKSNPKLMNKLPHNNNEAITPTLQNKNEAVKALGKPTQKNPTELSCDRSTDLSSYSDTAEANVLKEWLWSLGLILPESRDLSQNYFISNHPYQYYNISIIESIAEASDSFAIQTLGFIYRGEAFDVTQPTNLLDMFSESFPFHTSNSIQINELKFEKSNQEFLRAVYHGRVEALEDIAWNYYYKDLFLRKNNIIKKDSKEAIELKIKSYAYSRARQLLIKELPLGLGAMKLNHENEKAINIQMEKIQKEVLIQYSQLGLSPPKAIPELLKFNHLIECQKITTR